MFFVHLFAGCALACNVLAADAVKLSGHPNWPPFSWQHGDRIVGIGPDLAEIVFKDVGLAVVNIPSGNWKRAQAQSSVGKVDGLTAAYRTTERLAYLVYPATPYMQDINVVWVPVARQFSFARWEDLIGKHGTAMLGESYGQQFDDFIRKNLTIEWTSTPRQSLQKLAMGRVDYYPFSLYGGKIQVREFGYGGRITPLAMPISTEDVHIAMSKKSKFVKYMPQIEAAIAARKADGTVERLIRKHTP